MKAFGTVLLVLGLVIVAPYLIGPVHMFVGGPRPPDNVSWAPVSLAVALIGIGAIVLAVRPGAKRFVEGNPGGPGRPPGSKPPRQQA